MDQRMIVKYLVLKKMISGQSHNDLLTILGFLIINYSIIFCFLDAESFDRRYPKDSNNYGWSKKNEINSIILTILDD
jgi:hypothetical protein